MVVLLRRKALYYWVVEEVFRVKKAAFFTEVKPGVV
jgi:hypothetical protein|tara:strand:+ start:386 stop:493 length:108 start_codon:yes stop_codon:yes gene_type:complete